MIKIVHFVNQFFAGVGGEDKASLPVSISDGSIGASRALAQKLGDQAQIVRTVYVLSLIHI